jgi:putative ABC transport system permease protein
METMFRNYFKTAWRNLKKSRFYTAINIFGLTAGLSVGILILLWVQDEKSFDRFHSQSKHIYRLENMVGTGASEQIWESTAAPIGIMAKNELPAIKDAARVAYNGSYDLMKYNDKVFHETRMCYTDPSLFSIFDFKLVRGNNGKPFTDNNSVVITETTATRYFGSDDPIGKIISADDKANFTVTGVVKDFPKNSSIKWDILFPMSLLAKTMYEGRPAGETMDNDFHQYSYETYLLFQPGATTTGLPDQLEQLHLRIKPDDGDITYLLLPLANMHLYKADGSDNGIRSVNMFIIIAILILVIACINYVNLSTARSMVRAKEVSLRKIVGAAKAQLFMQFIVETALLFMLATALSLAVMYFMMPLFNRISGKELVFDLADVGIWKVILITITGTLAASSIYPAVLLSSFEPLKALKGKISSRISDVVFRRVLVVVQFAFSIVLIAGTFIITRQLHYIHSKDLGYNKEHIFGFYMRGMGAHYDAVKANLMKQSGIVDVSRASSNIVRIGGQTGNNYWEGKEKGETMMVRPMSIDKDFMPFLKMNLATGQNFTGVVADSVHFILNETAVKTARIKDPIGKQFKLWERMGTIIGVVKDFHLSSMKNKIDPVVFYYQPPDKKLI